MILSEMLDYLAQPIVDIFADDFDEAEYWQPDWLKNELQTAETPDLSDLFITEQLDEYDTDTNMYVEFSDLEGVEGFGLITAICHYPYVFPIDDNKIDPENNYAYIRTDAGAGTYAHKNSIRFIERVVGYETTSESQPMPKLLPAATTQGQTTGQRDNQDLHELQHTAGISIVEAS